MDHWMEILLTLIGALGAAFGYIAQKHAKETNAAVNGNKNPDAVRLYDLVIKIDDRADRFESWMVKHKGESYNRDDSILENHRNLLNIKGQIERIGVGIESKIAEYGCPIRLGYTLKPLCGAEIDHTVAELAESKLKQAADKVVVQLRITAAEAARVLAAKPKEEKTK